VRSLGTAHAVIHAKALLGEGPRWDAPRERLLWVDIEAGSVHAFDAATGAVRVLPCGAQVGAVAPWDGDVVLVAPADALAAVDLAGGEVTRLEPIPHARDGMRCNDGACDAAGRFWFGTMAEDGTPGAGELYRYGTDGRLESVLGGLTLSNGLGWSPDGRLMYLIDSPEQRVDVFDFDVGAGAISNRRPFAAIPERDGIPDGLTVDDEGGVWVALFDGGQVRRFDRDGRPDCYVEVPADKVTACCFGGADGRRLLITTASVDVEPGRAEEQPLAGSVFGFDGPFSGPPANAFGGTRDA
jgi:uncharacterized repeat protein (TIGR03803 family)